MKKLFIEFQDKLMKIIVTSLIVMVGLFSVGGFFYSIILAFVYVKDGIHEDFKEIFRFKIFTASLLAEVLVGFYGFSLYLYRFIIPSLSSGVAIALGAVIICFTLMFAIMLLQFLWLVAQEYNVNSRIIHMAAVISVARFPLHVFFLLACLLVGVMIYLIPQLSILGIGGIIWLLHLFYQKNKSVLNY